MSEEERKYFEDAAQRAGILTDSEDFRATRHWLALQDRKL